MGSLNFQYKDGGNVPEGVGLLISILVRYPEVCSVRYLQKEHTLELRFILHDVVDQVNLTEKLCDALEVYHRLEGNVMQTCTIDFDGEENLSILTITRDIQTISQIEVSLVVELIKIELMKELVYEEFELEEDELAFQEKVICDILEAVKKGNMDKSFIAVREEGRVLVYKN